MLNTMYRAPASMYSCSRSMHVRGVPSRQYRRTMLMNSPVQVLVPQRFRRRPRRLFLRRRQRDVREELKTRQVGLLQRRTFLAMLSR